MDDKENFSVIADKKIPHRTLLSVFIKISREALSKTSVIPQYVSSLRKLLLNAI